MILCRFHSISAIKKKKLRNKLTNQQTDQQTDEQINQQTNGETDKPSYSDAWMHLKKLSFSGPEYEKIRHQLFNIKN